jgi:hypothetical protein
MRLDDFPDHFTPLDTPLSAFANFGFFPFVFGGRWGWVYILSLRPDFIGLKILLVSKSVRDGRKWKRELACIGAGESAYMYDERESWDSEAGLY